jgi:hypothetical protein
MMAYLGVTEHFVVIEWSNAITVLHRFWEVQEIFMKVWEVQEIFEKFLTYKNI